MKADINYVIAAQGANERFNRMMAASPEHIASDPGMRIALDYAYRAWSNEGEDPSNGAFWWDGKDFRTKYPTRPKVIDGFRFGDPSHNASFGVKESSNPETLYWKHKNKKTGKEVNGNVRGRYLFVWLSTAAHGETIFWRYDPHYLKVTGGKAYL